MTAIANGDEQFVGWVDRHHVEVTFERFLVSTGLFTDEDVSVLVHKFTSPCIPTFHHARCWATHREGDEYDKRRRSPIRDFYYLPERCTEHTENFHWNLYCPRAHTISEVVYHPFNYKMKECKRGDQCRKKHCPFSHDKEHCERLNAIKDKIVSEYNRLRVV